MRLFIVLALTGVALVHGVEGAGTHARAPAAAEAVAHSDHGHDDGQEAGHDDGQEAEAAAEQKQDAVRPDPGGRAGEDPSRHIHKGADCLGFRTAVLSLVSLEMVSAAVVPSHLTHPQVRRCAMTPAWKPRPPRVLLAELSVFQV